MLYPDNESFYIMVGMTSAKYEDYLSDFRKIAQSFTLK
jgi:hypothetical protein